MPIKIRTLRSASTRYSHVVTKSLVEAVSKKQPTAFLCHSHIDQQLAKGLQILLNENGWNVYIDWLDEKLPPSPSKETAEKIKIKIRKTDWFLFLATTSSTRSRWCPWEIGYADAVKNFNNILIIPTEDDSGNWHGNEYLQLYKKITDASNARINKSGYAVFDPGVDHGDWVENLQ